MSLVMRKLLFTFCILIAFSLQAQPSVVIPRKFEFQKEANKHQLNELTKFLFDKYGFVTIWEDKIPKDLENRHCELLFAKVTDDSTFFSTKLKVHLNDCQGTEVYISEEGTSREKEYKKAYHTALRDAFTKGNLLTKFRISYKNSPQLSDAQEPEKVKLPKEIKEKTKLISETISSEVSLPEVFVQKLKDGVYQLVDSTPKIVLKIYKTSLPNVFIAENENTKGIFHKENGKYVYEYYQNGKLIKKVFDVELL